MNAELLIEPADPARTRSLPPLPRPTVANPILPEAPDPWICLHDGFYFLTYTTGNGIELRRSVTLAGLAVAARHKLWTAPGHGPTGCNVWAPELHRLDDRWHIFFAADDGHDANHRLFVMSAEEPLGPYTDPRPLAGLCDHWAIDATILHHASRRYLVWSGWAAGKGPQNLYIAPMNGLDVVGPRTLISAPQFAWEKNGWAVNEGPAILQRNGQTFLFYSASGGSTPNYCLGRLDLVGDNPLDPRAWRKIHRPVFTASRVLGGGVYGPGHCCFFRSPDGGEDWMIYHAKAAAERSWRGRSARVQPVNWANDGQPQLGRPLPAGFAIPAPSGENLHVRLAG